MVAQMNRIENAARLAMADMGSDASKEDQGVGLALKFGMILASFALACLVAASIY
jgi:hypothetical protein